MFLEVLVGTDLDRRFFLDVAEFVTEEKQNILIRGLWVNPDGHLSCVGLAVTPALHVGPDEVDVLLDHHLPTKTGVVLIEVPVRGVVDLVRTEEGLEAVFQGRVPPDDDFRHRPTRTPPR